MEQSENKKQGKTVAGASSVMLAEKEKAIQFVRNYSPILKDYERWRATDDYIEYMVMSVVFDILSSGIISHKVDRIGENHYIVTPETYSYLKREGFLGAIGDKVLIEVR